MSAERSTSKTSKPCVVVLAGPNGAGKSTSAPLLLRGALGVDEFVNADEIARGLSAFSPEKVAISAGKIMLKRLRVLANQRKSFAFEATLANKHLARWIKDLRRNGYAINLVFLWLPNSEMAIARVQERVAAGGHDVPKKTRCLPG